MNDNKKCKWKVSKTNAGHYLLEYLPGCLGENGATIKVTEEIYNIGKNEDISLADLFTRFDLYKIEPLYEIKPTVCQPDSPRIDTLTKYQGSDFFVTKEDNKYYLEYLLSTQGGKSRKFEISMEIYKRARTGNYSTSNLFKKYNLYHLDIPENDVKK